MLTQSLPTWRIDAFEPYISTETMEIHVNQLHKGYVDKLNKNFDYYILEQKPSYVLKNLTSYFPTSRYNDAQRRKYRFLMGGNVAHTLLWKSINPDPERTARVNSIYQYTEGLKGEIEMDGVDRVGSGWGWGAIKPDGGFTVYSTPNHDTPYMRGYTPVFCMDVWEHAYFLDYHGDRKKWLEVACEFLDWDFIDRRASEILNGGPDQLDNWILGN